MAKKIQKIDKDSTALIVIDMQNDFTHEDGYSCRMAKELGGRFDTQAIKGVISRVRSLAEAMREAGIPVIYCQSMYEPDYADAAWPLQAAPRAKEFGFMVKGTLGAEIAQELAPQHGDYVVECKAISKFSYTPLEVILRNKGIHTLVFAGTATNVCVEATVRDATSRGFQLITTSDGTFAMDDKTHQAALESIARSRVCGAVMTCEEVIAALQEA